MTECPHSQKKHQTKQTETHQLLVLLLRTGKTWKKVMILESENRNSVNLIVDRSRL